MDLRDDSLRQMFHEAQAIPAGAARTTYLDRVTLGNPGLRARLDALLEAHRLLAETFGLDSAGLPCTRDDPLADFVLDSPVSPSEVASGSGGEPQPEPDSTANNRKFSSTAEESGVRIGPYRLLQRIGEGGMGDVFLAEQEKPIRRKVALKVIKPGMDTLRVIARFEAERQALSMMDHPHIARVLDVGATETGRPYFVMELVRGLPITDYCDQNHRTLRERLELFVLVCRAIQHAHQKGIIHRDIKPSNVLVTFHDVQPEPKVIDFGVAKAIDQRLTERTVFTEYGVIIGTLEYMSPEQAELGAIDIDTRSDIYSLGVLLYELLTGTTPLERARFGQASFETILRWIREEDPPSPSTRFGEVRDRQTAIAARRRLEPVRLCKLLQGELDWIVLKALEKDRTRRYETANGLARDIQHYLDGDTVEACPPSPSYKLRKFARKHQVALTFITAFGCLLVSATAVSVGLAWWANSERVRATDQRTRAFAAELTAQEQRDRAVVAERSAIEERVSSTENEQIAISAVRSFGDAVNENQELKDNPNLAHLRKTILQTPQKFFRTLRDRLQAKRQVTPDSLARLAKANYDLARLTDEIGDRLDALKAWGESRVIWERLVTEYPADRQFRADLASTYVAIGTLQRNMNWLDDALVSFEASRLLNEQLVRDDPTNPVFQQNLAWSRTWIAAIYTDTKRHAEASASLEEIHAVRLRLAHDAPQDAQFRLDLATSYNDIGDLHRTQGRGPDALAAHEEARVIAERLTLQAPQNIQFQIELATSLHNLGEAQTMLGRLPEAMARHRQAQAIWVAAASDHPSNNRLQIGIATSHYYVGLVHFNVGWWPGALSAFEQRRAVYEHLARENPTNTRHQTKLVICLNNIGLVHWNAHREPEALGFYEQARRIRVQLVADYPNNYAFRFDLAASYANIGRTHARMDQLDPALAACAEARQRYEDLVRESPANAELKDDLIANQLQIALIHQDAGRLSEAATAHQQARTAQAEVDAAKPDLRVLDDRLASVLQGQPPRDNPERLALVRRAYARRLYATSARLAAEALVADPQLAEDRRQQVAYKVACVAAQAGMGRGWDDPPIPLVEQASWRQRALACLRSEFAAWTQVFETCPADLKMQVLLPLVAWKTEDDLIGIREERKLARLPTTEQVPLRQFWGEVDQFLARVGHP